MLRVATYTFGLLVFTFVLSHSVAGRTPAGVSPATAYWEGEQLLAVKQGGATLGPEVAAAIKELQQAADLALDNTEYAVTNKSILPPSGDKHDYISFSRYWWPNPETDTGLPYIRRDGEVNRGLVAKGDRVAIGLLYEDLEALSLAAFLIDAERYAPKARRLIEVWFLDEETSMNPSLQFAQGVPGKAHGRGSGILDTRGFIRVLDSVAVLEAADAIPPGHVNRLREWFVQYLEWLIDSKLGQDERRAKNNHGAWYAAQVTAIALFVGREDLARELIIETRDRRIPSQIADDGRQPEELKRTMSLHYSLFSLSALATVARLGESLDMDLWNYESPSGASIAKAMSYAAPYAAKQDDWPHQSLHRHSLSDSQSQVFYLTATRIEPVYLEYLAQSPRRPDRRILSPLLFTCPE